MEIKLFEEKYRDDTIYMIMQTKEALGRIPRLNEDLLDVKTNYFDRGGMFWVAVDENDRVIGSGGFLPVEGTTEARVKRLYVKASLKRRGIGSALLETIEDAMRAKGYTVARLRLGADPEQWFESYAFYPKHGYTMYEPRFMMKVLQEETMVLTEPSREYADQIRAYRSAFLARDDSMDGTGGLARCEDPLEWIARTEAFADPAAIAPGKVPATQYLYVRRESGKIVGMIQIRHRLNDYLEQYAGHIGYSVAPDERRRGYATRMLAAALAKCREMGLDRVLITCGSSNEGSRRTILNNGGVYESTVHEPEEDADLERYWIDLSV